ncbi:hypothetical protein Q8791_29050 [Nocardiopsis sp. CT-R113]|uniref:Uncharacterized protein n=1 Tax=Nocardiopsis codii TaxID=3065942 RepID=A0ABU7KGD9_9ACTN|nr:hypothetical protein [Nocardiopsis sp. CT-R113]MEE2041280.1 hypothetical protein [Nocardiopsis sp. CT-R113]
MMKVRVKTRLSTGRVLGQARAGEARGLGVAGEHLLGASRQRVPIEEGTLERSGVASVDESSLEAAVSYDTEYAARQHQEDTWQHDPGRTSRYLENPFEEEAETMLALYAAEVRRSLGG